MDNFARFLQETWIALVGVIAFLLGKWLLDEKKEIASNIKEKVDLTRLILSEKEIMLKIQKMIDSVEKDIEKRFFAMEKKIDELCSSVKIYKEEKHHLHNENHQLKGTIEVCKSALEKAEDVIKLINTFQNNEKK